MQVQGENQMLQVIHSCFPEEEQREQGEERHTGQHHLGQVMQKMLLNQIHVLELFPQDRIPTGACIQIDDIAFAVRLHRPGFFLGGDFTCALRRHDIRSLGLCRLMCCTWG